MITLLFTSEANVRILIKIGFRLDDRRFGLRQRNNPSKFPGDVPKHEQRLRVPRDFAYLLFRFLHQNLQTNYELIAIFQACGSSGGFYP